MELTDHVGALTSVVAAQAQVIADQNRTIHALSGAGAKALALEMAIGDAWERYCRTLPDVRWKVVVVCMMRRFVARFKDVRVGNFGPLDWESFRDDPVIKAAYNPTTRNLIFKRARALFAWMVNTDQIPVNPLRRAKPERKVPKRRTEVSEADEQIVLGDINHKVMRAMFILAIDTGMRRNEVRTLEWADINWEERTLFLPAERTKTRTARTVYVTTRAIKELQGLPRYDDCPYVFANRHRKKPYSENFIWTRWRRVADENGLQPAPGDGSVRWHDLRRSTTCRLIRLGAPLAAVQELLGHADLASTFTYMSAQKADVIGAHRLLEKATRKGPQRAPGPVPAAAPVRRKRA